MADQIETVNAVITSTRLGIEDHGVLSFTLGVEGDGWGQGFGGICLDNPPDKSGEDRKPSILPGYLLARLFSVLGVGKWEDLKGQHVRIRRNWNQIYSIGHYTRDKWFALEELETVAKGK